MTAPRAGHTATLLDDGRVLVTGGFADYQNPATDWAAALNSAQSTAELYDPATGVWTPVAQSMSSKRAGHTATKLPDGTVMVINGINGGGLGSPFGSSIVPSFTPTVQAFDPSTETFAALPDLNVPGTFSLAGGRAFHGASVRSDGLVLVTGGVYRGGANGEAISTQASAVFDGTAWVAQAPLPVSVAWHNQLALADGSVLVSGGLTADGFSLAPKAFTGIHVGTTVLPLAAIGLNPGIPASAPEQRGAMSATILHDGSLLFLGGSTGTTTTSLASGYVYTPDP
jgi:hypothetical protein